MANSYSLPEAFRGVTICVLRKMWGVDPLFYSLKQEISLIMFIPFDIWVNTPLKWEIFDHGKYVY